MAYVPTGSAQYLERFSEQAVVCNSYALTRLGIKQNQCFLKIEEYIIFCMPFQLGFKRALFTAPLSAKEMAFFQRYVNNTVGLSLTLIPSKEETAKFFLHCSLITLGKVKNKEDTALFVVELKTMPDNYVSILGAFLAQQDRLMTQYTDYGRTPIRMTAETAKLMGYNTAAIKEDNSTGKHIQVVSLSTKTIEYLEAADSSEKPPGTVAAYQLAFRQFQFTVKGTVESSILLPQGLTQTISRLELCPALVEAIDNFYFNMKSGSKPVSVKDTAVGSPQGQNQEAVPDKV